MQTITLKERLRYWFDNFMSRGTIALIGGLAVLSLGVILVAAGLLTVTRFAQEGDEALSFGEAAWASLMRTLDSGTMGGDTGWGFRFVMLGVTLGGVFVISALIGVLNNGLEDRLEELRKGRSRVIEANHTVILGWSQQIFSIISELVAANANQPKSCIVIMGDKDKVEMEEEIRDRVSDTGKTRIVCRHGNPIDLNDLSIASLHTARSIILLSPESDDPDSSVIKTMLAITNHPQRRPEPYHIVAEIRDPKNMEAARLVSKDEAELVLAGDLISRIIAQTCRQSGLSVVYTELLDFGGDEIYFKAEPALNGKTFGEALLAYEDSTVIGLSSQKGAKLNPPMDTPLKDGDQLIVIAEDDDKIQLSGMTDHKIKEGAIRAREAAPIKPERTLILAWNWRAPAIINELDSYVAPGSAVTIVAEAEEIEEQIAVQCGGLKNQTLTVQEGDTTDRRTLDGLKVGTYQHVIVLSYSDTLEEQQADARTLVTLLHLRDIASRNGQTFSIVSEMLDIRNRALAEVTQADDFIVSDKLVSLMLSQVSENKSLNAVFTDLFDPEGSEIYLKPVANYVRLGEPVNFYTVVEAARRRGEVALGYRQNANAKNPAQAYGVVVNPDKSKEVAFGEADRVIVLAES
jgi:voltage-gated potassium channel Kch